MIVTSNFALRLSRGNFRRRGAARGALFGFKLGVLGNVLSLGLPASLSARVLESSAGMPLGLMVGALLLPVLGSGLGARMGYLNPRFHEML